MGSIFNISQGNFDIVSQFWSSLFDIVLLCYFLTSRRVKVLLVQPFDVETKQAHVEEDSRFFKVKSWPFWRNLIIYFCVFSVVGHWMEAGYCMLIRFGLIPGVYDPNSQIWSDWLYPFMVYGFGFVTCVVLLFPLKNFLQRKFKKGPWALILSFVISGCVCSLIELAMGLVLNQPLPDGSFPLWDYSDMFCNFMGQICLQNGVAFGIAATMVTWVVYPVLEKLNDRLSNNAMNAIFIVVVVGFAILICLYYINIVNPIA